MKRYFWYISKHFIINFVAILIGLSVMFVIINYMNYASRIEGAFNQKVAFLFYSWESALSLLYPLSLLFGVIATKVQLVKSNTMTALYSFGFSNKKIILPILLISFVVYLFFVGLQNTSFAYAADDADAITTSGGVRANAQDIFLKYEDKYIFIKSINPAKNELVGVSLFSVKDNKINYYIKAPSATYEDKNWVLSDATMLTNRYDKNALVGYTQNFYKHYETLHKYKPNVINSIFSNNQNMRLSELFDAYKLLNTQGINTSKIRSIMYDKVISPFFIFGLIVLMFYKIPHLSRYENMLQISSIAVAVGLMIWGLLLGAKYLGFSGTLPPEVAMFVPIGAISLLGLRRYYLSESIS